MSAIFRAELANLQRLVRQQHIDAAELHSERKRSRIARKSAEAADRQAVIDTLANAARHLTSTEVSSISGVNRQRCDRILDSLCAEKIAYRHRRRIRRADGQGHRNPYKYGLVS